MATDDIDVEQQYFEALAMKKNGNEKFAAGDYSCARDDYEFAAECLEDLHASITHQQDHSDLLQNISSELSKIYSNNAECSLRLEMYFYVVTQANKSLEWDKDNLKSILRRAKANVELANYSEAKDDIEYLKSRIKANSEVTKLDEEIQERYQFLYRLIDSYRLRVEDEYVQTGDVCEDSLYSGTCPIPLRHFRAYVRMAVKKDVLPSWFHDMNGNNFDVVSEIAKTDEHYTIRYPQEESDMFQHYNLLDRPNEVKALRKLAVKIQGPIMSGFNHLGEVEKEEDIRDYYSAHDSDCSDGGNWWQEAPFAPQFFDDWCEDTFEKFEKKFGKDPPIDIFPRFDYTKCHLDDVKVLGSNHSASTQDESDSDKFVKILLESKFGMEKNGFDTKLFCKLVEDHQLIHKKNIGLHETDIKECDISYPTGKFFDHYGPVATLAIVAFKLLPEEDKRNPDVQHRLVHAVYGGEEDILTSVYLDDNEVIEEEWKGPRNGQKPEDVVSSWLAGKGSILMKKAWDVWYSIVRARDLLTKLEKELKLLNRNEDICSIANEAISLPCFSCEALWYIQPYRRSIPWDCGLNVSGLYVDIAILASKTHLAIGNYKEALEIAKRPMDHIALFDHKLARKRLNICQAQALVGLKRYRFAEERLKGIIDSSASKDESDLSPDEKKKVEDLISEIKDKRGPFPHREPTMIREGSQEGWWHFDASSNDDVKNFVLPGEKSPTIKLWGKQRYPDITNLEIKIDDLCTIQGIKEMFPNIKKLVVDDSRNDYRTCYGLEELKLFSETLESLELNLSGQWMNEGDNTFREILSQLKQLKNLRISHLRDGFDKDLKAIEELTLLESLTYNGKNEPYYGCNEGGDADTISESRMLDLSKLTKLKSCVFCDCHFCAKSEVGQTSQVLVPPRQLKEITCIVGHQAGHRAVLSKDLFNELNTMGVVVKAMEFEDWNSPIKA